MNIIHAARCRSAFNAVIILSAFLCWAAPASAGEIIACVKNKTGATRIISPPGICKKNEQLVRWNKAGPQYPDGSVPAGDKLGDMLYWDGSAWVLIPAIAVPKGAATPRLSLCKSGPSWECRYQIGDTGPAGGIVFHVTEGGLHGLEAASNDLGLAPWGCKQIGIPAARKREVGAGASNTRAIVAQCSEARIAARLASDYTLNGYNDWFLPSRDELDLLYQHQDVVGAFVDDNYWSSTEHKDSYIAYNQHFPSGSRAGYHKDFDLSVRPVRAF